MKNPPAGSSTGRTSPLYTPKAEADAKRAELARLGRDSDGASRVTGRITSQPSKVGP